MNELYSFLFYLWHGTFVSMIWFHLRFSFVEEAHRIEWDTVYFRRQTRNGDIQPMILYRSRGLFIGYMCS